MGTSPKLISGLVALAAMTAMEALLQAGAVQDSMQELESSKYVCCCSVCLL